MSFSVVLFLAVGLAMDAFAVSISSGIAAPVVSAAYALKIALFFSGFQMLMPLLGWWLGDSMSQYIASYDHWIAFILLFAIGSRMAYESFQSEAHNRSINFNSTAVLLLLAVATSIDALIAGVSLSILRINRMHVIIIIGIITLLFSLIGVKIGKILGCRMEKYAQLVGGIILITIGIQLLWTHIRG